MQNTHLEEEARWLLTQLATLGRHNNLRDPMTPLLEKSRLTPSQIHGIAWLGHDGALRMGELAQRLGVSEKTVTGIVDRLERGDFVARVRKGDDRRVVRVELTLRGRQTFRRLAERAATKVSCLLSFLETEERAVLHRFVTRLVAAHGHGVKERPCKR